MEPGGRAQTNLQAQHSNIFAVFKEDHIESAFKTTRQVQDI